MTGESKVIERWENVLNYVSQPKLKKIKGDLKGPKKPQSTMSLKFNTEKEY